MFPVFSRALLLVTLLPVVLIASDWEVPDLQLQNLNGKTEKLSDYRGKIVVLNFWATWCVPCRKEMPLFVELQKQYESRGVQFIAVSVDGPESQNEISKFVRKYKVHFPVWVGATSENQAAFRLGTGLPATIIIDHNGKACFRIIGESKREQLVSRLEYLLSRDVSSPPVELIIPEGMTPEHFQKAHERGDKDSHETEEHPTGGSEVPS